MNHFAGRNDYILDHEVNKNFEEILWMSEDEFRSWIVDMRKAILYAWDELGLPPRVGYDEDAIIAQMDKMESFPVHKFELTDELTGNKDLIRNTSVVGNVANAWFPSMMATRINYTLSDDGKSIHDHFANDELLEKVTKYGRRHFKRDSFYHYSLPVVARDKANFLFHCDTGEQWIKEFEANERPYGRSDYWLAPKKGETEYTGYNEELKGQQWLSITREQAAALPIPDKCKTNMDALGEDIDMFQIRYFEYGQKLFPVGLKAFRVSFCQYAVNFPPLTAKYLYEKFTQHIVDEDKNNGEEIVVYDPSSGWGGRILGAMAVRDDRTIHYVGTDPNTDHSLEGGGTKYEDLAEFYNTRTGRGTSLFPSTNTYRVFQQGSEVIGADPDFQRYRGKIDCVFTSPPYFAKELYSEDPTQSAKKFGQYDAWRDGFLRPTLETAVEFLKEERYLLWNIADAKFGKDMLPLENDSREILLSLGMEERPQLKMCLASMPGGNRLDAVTGLPKAKNFCKIKSADGKKDLWLKHEPIWVFWKPKGCKPTKEKT